MMRLPLGLNTRLPHEGCFSLQINAGLCAEMRFIKGILFSKTQFQNHYRNIFSNYSLLSAVISIV